MPDEILIIAAIFEGSRDLKDRTKKLQFVTNEVTPAQASQLQLLVQEFCYIAIKKEPFSRDEVNLINDLKTDFENTGKTHSQRLRAVLYKLWEQNNEGYKDFNLYYQYHMELFITHLKGKIL